MKRKQQQEMLLLQNHGRTWKRGTMLGRGSFGTVFLATTTKPNTRQSYLPPIMAVKSADISQSSELQKEREILSNLQGSPHVFRCFGDEFTTTENDQMIYNVLLEYGSGGTLADQKSNGGLPESNIKRHTRSILRGLNHIHCLDYVHCDIKPENILLVPDSSLPPCSLGCGGIGSDKFAANIADFGLAKNIGQNKRRKVVPFIRGTPLYMSLESVVQKVQEYPADIWALGCVVAEMVNGKSVWDCLPDDLDVDELLSHIGYGGKLPEIPLEISKWGKDFLKRCFVRNSMFRWTAEMLLLHPFVDDDEEIEESENVITALDTDAIDSSSSSLVERSDLSSSSDDLDALTEAGSSPDCARSEGADGMNVSEATVGDKNRSITSSITSTSLTSTDYHILKTSIQTFSSTMQQQHEHARKSTEACAYCFHPCRSLATSIQNHEGNLRKACLSSKMSYINLFIVNTR